LHQPRGEDFEAQNVTGVAQQFWMRKTDGAAIHPSNRRPMGNAFDLMC